ncbi:MAG TPA: CARDB domain-containing protein [Gaiellaceae bacterium]|nr:CARDB domain-containing protein [Gaiellaceae bacterium]
MSSYDDNMEEFDFFEERETEEAPRRARRARGPGGGEPRRPVRPPSGAIAMARLVGLVALAIAVVVGLVFWVGACQGKSRHDEYASYMEKVRTIAQSSAQVGREFATKLGSPGLKLADLETRLEQWSQQQTQLYDRAQQIRPPGPLRDAHDQVLDTLQLRAIGLAGLANSLTQTSSKDATSVATALAGQAQLLSASDLVWTELYRLPATETLKTLGITGVVVPPSQFVTNPETISVRSFTIVAQELKPTSSSGSSSSSSSPAGLHGSRLVSTKAAGGGRSDDLSEANPTTIYVAADLALQVTVENSGNAPEVNIPVTLTVKVAGSTLFTKKQTITGMQPGDQQTLSFTNLQITADAFGHPATVEVVVGAVPGEKTLDNNKASYPVFFSLSQP